MKKILYLFAALGAVFCFGLLPVSASAHALLARDLSTRDVCVVEFVYSTDDIARYAKTEVYSPDNPDIEYQNGRTDAKGRFAFVPDKPGTWIIVVSDGMGHRVTHGVNMVMSGDRMEEKVAVPTTTLESLRAMPLIFRVVLGLSIILNLCLFVSWWRARKRDCEDY